MAKQAGDIRLTGTFDDLCFYRMDGRYYVRCKSSLNSQRFWKDKAFEGSRKSASRFAAGNRLASRVYKKIEEEKRAYTVFCFLKRTAILLLKKGLAPEKAEKLLVDYLVDFGLLNKPTKKQIIGGARPFFPRYVVCCARPIGVNDGCLHEELYSIDTG